MKLWTQDTRIANIWTKWFNSLIVTLILSGLLANSEAKTMEEAACHPRPVTVPVTEGHEVLPYHVLLHRCSGTCHNTSPRVKACEVKNFVEIDLKVNDVINNQKKIVKVKNHTSCYCRCNCKSNEIPVNQDSCNCRCIENCHPNVGGPDPVASGSRKGDEKKYPIPYLVGIIAVGAFALIVLLFDAVMCFKKNTGFSHFIKKHAHCGKKDSPSEPDGSHAHEDVALNDTGESCQANSNRNNIVYCHRCHRECMRQLESAA